MNFKKLSYYLLLILLTLGASLIIGLLSFGGLYVLWPSLMFASFAFILSVVYEGEIYLQNIKGALNKLFTAAYLKLETARTFLKDYFPHHLPENERPQFFKDYVDQLEQLPCELDKKQGAKKLEIEEKLKNMEAEFARLLSFRGNARTLSKDDQALHKYLTHYAPPSDTKKSESLLDKYQALIKKHQKLFTAAQLFSALTAIFMGFGTTYLLLETFAVIPFLAAIPLGFVPILIVPMAIISGVAYGLLTYNTITNIITNDRIRTRFNKLYQDVKTNGLTWRNALMMTATLVLGSLAVMLTLCTAGTWWTIVKQTPPLFRWMQKLPSFVMGIITPIVTSIAALAFNLENSCESLDMIDDAMQEGLDLKKDWAEFKNKLNEHRQKENIAQLLNPFRLIIACTILPLQVVLFLGHLISIGVTADRVPGLTKILSACLGVISEFFEDLHYFVQHKHRKHDIRSLLDQRLSDEHGHNHDNNLPKRILNFIALPLYALSGLWNYISSQFNSKEYRLEFASIFQQQVQLEVPIATPISNPMNVQKAALPTSKTRSSKKISTAKAGLCCPNHAVEEKKTSSVFIAQATAEQKIAQITSSAIKQKVTLKQNEKTLNAALKIEKTPTQKQPPHDDSTCLFCPPKSAKSNKSNIALQKNSFFSDYFCTVIPSGEKKKSKPQKAKTKSETANLDQVGIKSMLDLPL